MRFFGGFTDQMSGVFVFSKPMKIFEMPNTAFKNVDPDNLAAKEFAKFDENAKQILADMFVDMSIDAGEKLSTIKAAGLLNKNTASEGGKQNKIGVITEADVLAVQSIGRKSINHFSSADIQKTTNWAQKFYKEIFENCICETILFCHPSGLFVLQLQDLREDNFFGKHPLTVDVLGNNKPNTLYHFILTPGRY